LTPYVSQGSAATGLREGGSFSYFFFRRSFLNLTVKNYENWSTFAEVIIKIKVARIFEGKKCATFIFHDPSAKLDQFSHFYC